MSDDTDATTPSEPEPETTTEAIAEAATTPDDHGRRGARGRIARGGDKGKRWQRIASVVLLVLGFILVPLSAVAIWTHNQLTNTDRYVETVSPLAENADIQATVAAVAVNAIFENVNIEQRVADALRSGRRSSPAPVATAARSYATDVTEKLLASDQFQNLWDAANRRAHNQLVALLTDDPDKAPGSVSIKDGQVKLDLGNVVEQVQGKLVDAGPHVPRERDVPPVSTTIAIINTEGLSEARQYVVDPRHARLGAPGARRARAHRLRADRAVADDARRSAPRWCSWPPACSRSCCSRSHARCTSTRPTGPNVYEGTASAVFDILVRNLRYGVITLGVVGVIVAVGRLLRRAVGAGEEGASIRRQGDRRRPQQGG